VCGEDGWNAPGALATWVGSVAEALRDLVAGRLPEDPGYFWFVDGNGRHARPLRRS
jgi:hypothetical protein